MADLIKGIDISTIQGHVDFAACAAVGIQFVICRCGVGNSGKDANYDKNVAEATNAGLKVAAYHFVYPLPPAIVNGKDTQPLRDPVKQAQLHASWVGNNVKVVCCDLEWPAPQDWAKWGCSAQQIVAWVITYLQTYEAITGIRPIVYTYPYFAKAINLPQDFADTYKLWIASYEPNPIVPKPWTDWVLWQDSSGSYRLPITGIGVDTDKARDLSLWDMLTPQPVVSPPPPDPAPVLEPQPTPPPPVPDPVSVQSETHSIFYYLWNFIMYVLGRR
jgi:GH25 family lysozyme M1 (1,4-beta-N-acetylmuramidase)